MAITIAGLRKRLGVTRRELDQIAYIRSLMPATKERHMELAAFAEAVRTYATLMGASATSWGRTTQHNKAVGGVTYSAHRFWMACDVVYDPPQPSIDDRRGAAARLGLKLVIENDHDHLEPGDWIPG